MRLLLSFFLFALTLACVLLLNQRISSYPPLGKFLDPVNGFWANSEKEGINAPAQLSFEGLKTPVEIYWDSSLIPHIVAQSDYDLYFAQGYVTAFHRLWQMEFQLFKTEGRLSEILGPLTLNYDRWQRRKGLRYAAEATCTEADKLPETNTLLSAYADGVNAYISNLSYADYPIEYKLLDYAPAPWSPYKSCLLIKEMGDILSLTDRDIENTHLIQVLGKDTFDLLFPERNPGLSYVVPEGTPFDFEPLQLPPASKDTLQLQLPKTEGLRRNVNGSNTAVISREKSATGRVLFANEPDLDLNLPSMWYLVHLVSPSGQTMGGSIPGLPGVVIGFNDSIAWGLTNAQRDLSDWYSIQFTDNSRQEYFYINSRYKTKIRIEEIQVRKERTLYDTVIYTHYGPVVYDRNYGDFLAESVNLARKWGGYEPHNEVALLYYLNRAKNYDEFVSAISHLKTPSQNISFGSAQGDIAIWQQGSYPLKWIGQGKFIMDGSKSVNDWHDKIPQSHAPYVKNPEQGFVSAANEHPTDETYPYYIYSHKFEYFRGRRLRERLQRMDRVQIKDLIGLQYDNFNYIAYESLPLMLDSLDRTQLSVEESKAYDILTRWDFFNQPHLLAPTYFEYWFDTLKLLIWDEFEAIPQPKYLPNTYNTIYLMRNREALSFYDKIETPEVERLPDLLLEAFKKCVAAVQTWQQEHDKSPNWANVRGSIIRHLLRIAPFGVDDLPIGGNHNILNAVKKDHGPSLRLVAELSPDEVQAWAVYPGSQPGNPGHPSYASLISRWLKADYIQLLFSKEPAKLQGAAVFTQKLTPLASDN